jgi:hypothetical protein
MPSIGTPVLLAGIEFSGFANTAVGYPPSGNDQWPAVIPSQYLKSAEAGLCPVSAGIGTGCWLMADLEVHGDVGGG